MDRITQTFLRQNQALRVAIIGGTAWFALSDLCLVLGRITSEEAAGFLTGAPAHPWKVAADLFVGEMAVSEEGLWTVVSLANHQLHEGPARWLHQEVLPATRRAAFEACPTDDSTAVRELWYVYGQLAGRGDLVNFTSVPGELAVHCGDFRVAAMRRGYAVPSQAKLTASLKESRSPLFIGTREINYLGRHVHCHAFRVAA